jgi:succinate dehydrogenase/fumarate reductase flavoprotein subunit
MISNAADGLVIGAGAAGLRAAIAVDDRTLGCWCVWLDVSTRPPE